MPYKNKMYYTYIVRCEDDSVYTGITNDVGRRMKEHFSKNQKCAKYTASHTAKQLEALWQSESRSAALKLEFRIKQLTKPQKEKLISENDLSVFKDQIDAENYERIKITTDGGTF